ncbi:MAG: type I methionyl aminopeptidase [Candidatus Levybacteria bacterium CG_4_9_14_3_um_filter_35_16]|nr:MAG: type I methionyl aminopeptidase [Candidatus Levybacteria bacterium CG22_combo_CG10-13_8_21_14_all_35_11]PJA91353.1 MAG: type I methionyl aminopeptidase [Candidatus Levybacteria bacterium CG_4_9_14_3_um_filter_35_16]PJC54792.1 MAG: type I methionyl aminopeptidase [Candidatus Levybacteria bacterium CG_4_9_14_0_2_um_filter_35_21]
MIIVKTKEEIEKMRIGGKILADVVFEVLNRAKPGITELALEKFAEELIIKKGGFPGFKKVKGYKFATCISTNDVIVHGIPGNYSLKEEDVFGLDCGVYYEGFFTDMSETIRVRNSKFEIRNSKLDEIDEFLETGGFALNEAIKKAKIGNRVGHISKTIQDIVEDKGYSVVRDLIGHGVGRKLHEEPGIPGYLVGKIGNTSLLKEGMTIAIEVIYNMGKSGIRYSDDQWTIRTQDKSLSGLFERTVAITKKGPVILTR